MNVLHFSALASVASLCVAHTLIGPPHMTVRAASSTAEIAAGTAFELVVEHHTRPDQLTVTGRAEGVRDGKRVSQPLTLKRVSDERFTVARQWDEKIAWVLVFSAEQGPRGAHGVVEAVVSINAKGAVQKIVYTPAAIPDRTGTPLRDTRTSVDAALKSLGLMTAAKP